MTPRIAYSQCGVGQAQSLNVVLALFDPEDFLNAQSRISDLLAWRDHEDFVQERESAYFGYGTAGVTAHMQVVSYAGFARWIRLTGASADLPSLDRFAEHWLWRAQNPRAPVKGWLRRDLSSELGFVGEGGVQRVAIFPEGFRCWRKALARVPSFQDKSPTMHAYASFAVETCICEGQSIDAL